VITRMIAFTERDRERDAMIAARGHLWRASCLATGAGERGTRAI